MPNELYNPVRAEHLTKIAVIIAINETIIHGVTRRSSVSKSARGGGRRAADHGPRAGRRLAPALEVLYRSWSETEALFVADYRWRTLDERPATACEPFSRYTDIAEHKSEPRELAASKQSRAGVLFDLKIFTIFWRLSPYGSFERSGGNSQLTRIALTKQIDPRKLLISRHQIGSDQISGRAAFFGSRHLIDAFIAATRLQRSLSTAVGFGWVQASPFPTLIVTMEKF
ncbi:hypothetical protein EVAR_4800_1 [Eumeta japonica]|uniref:Uncharacterized protein n=1 Tax=Eumeta variegata TaxID=151549 RepID=A0A4C1SZN7_EUMVA|nr:hypothetical protein EVAR_4800_1 [Eumeta japonica]